MPRATPPIGLAPVGIFADLDETELAAMANELDPMPVPRGEVLVRQGEAADALYIVVSGRFEVTVAGNPKPIAEIGAGAPVGEIAFLAGGTRTATVTAVRDSLVARLERADFDRLCTAIPRIWQALTATLARRLGQQNARRAEPRSATPRTLAILRAGPEPVPASIVADIAAAFARLGSTRIVDAGAAATLIAGGDLASGAATEALNALERAYDTVVYVTDPMLTAWSEKAIRQADVVIRVAAPTREPSGPVDENVLERFAAGLVAPSAQRLLIVHPDRRAPKGTRHWLGPRKLAMHHHAARGEPTDLDRLARFVTGRAIGLVACGGGAFCAAHVGLYQALAESGVTFDIMGGTSGGSAMAAGFAMGLSTSEIDEAVDEIFVRNRALRRYTVPRYSILDHSRFDRLLEASYGGIDIEDLWIPFFAVSTNLSRYGLHSHRTGSLWAAVRASGSIPALLPPYYTADGEMLVDGALMDNVPVRVMHELKQGPNVVVAFEVPELERFSVDYRRLPTRGALLRRLLLPIGGEPLPRAPSLGAVLTRSLLANRHAFERYLQPDDLVLVPPLPLEMSVLDWGRHSELLASAHAWGLGEIARVRSAGHPALATHAALPLVRARRGIEQS